MRRGAAWPPGLWMEALKATGAEIVSRKGEARRQFSGRSRNNDDLYP